MFEAFQHAEPASRRCDAQGEQSEAKQLAASANEVKRMLALLAIIPHIPLRVVCIV